MLTSHADTRIFPDPLVRIFIQIKQLNRHMQLIDITILALARTCFMNLWKFMIRARIWLRAIYLDLYYYLAALHIGGLRRVVTGS